MRINQCNYDLDTKFVESCGKCRISRFQRKTPIRFGSFILYVTYKYEIRNCLEGFTDGDFLYALSLLPKEEQEVEIIQRAKFERHLHEQRSVESEFENEFMNTFRAEISASHDVNVSGETGAEVNIFDIVKAGAKGSISTSTHFGLDIFNETVVKASTKVSNYYEVAVDIKSEIENQYRSLRRIVNPNDCRVVTYFFKQLNKKFKIEIALVDIRFDLIQKVPKSHSEMLPYFEAKIHPFVGNLRAISATEVQEQTVTPVQQMKFSPAQTEILSQKNPAVKYYVTNNYHSLFYRDIELAKELNATAFLQKIEEIKLDTKQKEEILKEFNLIINKEENKTGYIIYKSEYCIRTNSVIAEPKVSNCSICECSDCECKENKGIKEMEKLKTEIEILKKQLE